MSSRKKIFGICHLCGNDRELSFEHVPPRAAFNDKPVIKVRCEEIIGLGPDEIVKGPLQQRGIGGHTLCIKCNSDTGGWYGRPFVDWCYQAMHILIKSGGKPSLVYLNYLLPLRILKQVVTMFFSVNADTFGQANPELVRFVLDRDRKYLPPAYRFFIYYNTTGRFRLAGIVGQMNLLAPGAKPTLMSEITFPPFGYLMTLDSEPPDKRLFEITHFSRYDYNEFKVMTLKLPVLPTHLAYPGDYRTKEEILQQAARSRDRNGA
jgi:hypothetical protein